MEGKKRKKEIDGRRDEKGGGEVRMNVRHAKGIE